MVANILKSLILLAVCCTKGIHCQYYAMRIPGGSETDVVEITRKDFILLYNSLLSSYDTRIRPVKDQSNAVAVNSEFVLESIISFDTSNQKFSLSFYVRVNWTDQIITWDSTKYDGTNYIKLPLKDIWHPKLAIVEEFDGINYIGNPKTDIAKISSVGVVQWVPEGIYSVVCEVDIQFYPYDEQTCTFSYYIANEDNHTVSLDHEEEINLDEYMENAAWKLVDISRERKLNRGNVFINVHFRLQRRAHFATFTIVTPLLMLAFLNVGVFLVPSGSGEKGGFAITVFLAYGIFITIVSDTLPHNSLQVSYFVLLIIALLAISAFSVLYAVVQAKLFATIADKDFILRFRANKVGASIEEEESDQMDACNIGTAKKDEIKGHQSKKYTWRMFLNTVDAVMCVTFFILVSLAAVVFFCVMFNHIAEDLKSRPKL